jgi:hypothetical protein
MESVFELLHGSAIVWFFFVRNCVWEWFGVRLRGVPLELTKWGGEEIVVMDGVDFD